MDSKTANKDWIADLEDLILELEKMEQTPGWARLKAHIESMIKGTKDYMASGAAKDYCEYRESVSRINAFEEVLCYRQKQSRILEELRK